MKLFGFLFSWGKLDGLPGNYAAVKNDYIEALREVPQFSDISGRQGVSLPAQLPDTWRLINFRSSKPLAGEDIENRRKLDSSDFVYRVFVRVKGEAGTIIFASRRYSITEAAVMTMNTYLTPKMQRRNIRVPELSARLLENEGKTEYFVTFLNADVPGFGDSLRSISLEGEDIAGAGFFNFDNESGGRYESVGLNYANFTARRIGLRPIASRHECGRFGADNRIEFSDDAIQELEEFLTYVGV